MENKQKKFKAVPYKSGNSRVIVVPDYLFKSGLIEPEENIEFIINIKS